ncbi:hypothetical protein JCM9279_004621 [Rhodotorula babjevae]
MDAEHYELGVTAPRARTVQHVTTSTTTESSHAPRRPSRASASDSMDARRTSLSAPSPDEYALLHLGPATTTTTVTTTTHTTTHFAPLRIPKSRPLRPVYSSFSGPSGDAAPRYDPPLTPRSALRRLHDNEASASSGGPDGGSALALNPRMYPLSQAEWPGSMRQFRMALGGMQTTFVEDPADEPVAPAGQRPAASRAAGTRAKGKEPALPTPSRANDGDESLSPFDTGTARGARDGRGLLHQRRLSRRGRAHGGGSALEWMDEDDEEQGAAPAEQRPASPGPPRKRARTDSMTADGRRPSADVDMAALHAAAVAGRRASQAALLNSFVSAAPLVPAVAATLPSPNQSPPSPVPTAGGDDSQGDELLDEAIESGDAQQQQYDFGSGAALSSLLSLPDFIRTFDDLPATLQSYTIFQLLRRTPLPVLQTLNQIIEPSLRRDFLSDLPPELGAYILGFMDARTLCRASLVCRAWKRLVDGDALPRVWKDKLVADGLWVGDGGDEQEAIDIARGYKDDLFLQRWRAGVWDEQSSPDSKPDSVEGSTSSTQPTTSFEYRLASPSSSREPSPFPPAHVKPAYKALYRRRVLTRRNWKSGTPTRTMFPSSIPAAGVPNTNNGNHVVTCLQFDSDKIISASDDNTISVFDMKTGALRANLAGHIGGVWALKYSGNVLVSGSTDRTVRVWDLDSQKCTHAFVGHTSTVRCLQIVEPENVNPDPHGPPIWEPAFPLIVTGSRDSSLRVWKLPMPGKDRDYLADMYELEPDVDPASHNPYHLRHLTGHTQAVRALAAKGNTLVSGSYDMDVRVWNVSTGAVRHILRGHTQKVYSVVYDHVRKQCASGSMDSTVRLWSTETGECKAVLEGHTSLVGLLGLTHRNLVSAAADWTLRIWDPATGACRHALSAHQGAITCFQHDEHKVISGSDGTLKMWDVQTGEFVRDLLTNLTGVWQVAFDERFCVAAVSRNGRSEFEILDFGIIEPEPVPRPDPSAPAASSSSSMRTPSRRSADADDGMAVVQARMSDAAAGETTTTSSATAGDPVSTPTNGSSSIAAPSAPRLRPAGFPPSASVRADAATPTAGSSSSRSSSLLSSAIRMLERRNGSSSRAQAQASTSHDGQSMEVDAVEGEAVGEDDEMDGVKAEELD